VRKPYRAVSEIDPQALAAFQAGIRRRYSDEQILTELRESAGRLGRSPTMKEFAADPEAHVHPQTAIEHFGTWNAAKRAAGLMPRRFATREELLALREAGFDVAVGEERLERAVSQGAALAHRIGRLPKFADWAEARRADDAMLTEWQVYRMFESRRGAWATFQYLVRERLVEQGASVEPDGSVG
jgi:hypothetical protein